jgi:integrase
MTEHATTALLTVKICCKRRACLFITMSDNVRLSDQAPGGAWTSLKRRDAMTDARQPPALPAVPPQDAKVPVHLERLAETARDYARGAKAAATQRAYAADWRHYTAWCRRKELEPLPPDPQVVGLYLAASASEPLAPGKKPNAVRTIERRLSAIAWNCAQRGQPLDRADRHIAEVMSGIRRRHARPPDQKEAVLAEDLMRMVATLDHGLRGLRDRAILLIGFAGGLRRSEITGLDCGPDQTEEGAGWIEFLDQGILIRVRGKTGWREVEIGRGSSDLTCPVVALQTWLKLGRIAHGPLFRRIARGGKKAGPDRLADKHVARLVKRTALAAGVRGDLSEAERRQKFSGHSLRAGLATSANVDERYVQKHLGHASAEMTRRYQRQRDRFRVNLTKAAGL